MRVLTAGGAKPIGETLTAGGATPSTGGSSGGSGGDTITAVNKTGAVINEGDKVWIQKDARVSSTSFFTASSTSSSQGFITRTGNYMYYQKDGNFYLITSSSLTATQTISTSASRLLKYMDNGTIFYASTSSNNTPYRIDDNLVSILPDAYQPICEDLFVKYNTNNYLYKLNLDTFEEVPGGWQFENNALTNKDIIKIGNKLYINGKMYELPEGGGTISSDTTGTTVTGFPSTFKPCGVTSDGKYVLTCNSNDLSNGGTLKIYEVVNDTTFRLVSLTELPPEFGQFYNGASSPVCIFNPYTGILTCIKPFAYDYLIAKYENGSWNILPITIGIPENYKFCYGITISDDLTRSCYGIYRSSNYYGKVENLENVSGYAVIPYKGHNINNQTLTGKAKTSTEIEADVEVSTVLPNEVNVTVTANEDNVTLSME